MSELMNVQRGKYRGQLLTTVCALALLAGISGMQPARAVDTDAERPTVWIELGGQFESVREGQEPFTPPFVANIPANIFTSRPELQKPPGYSNGAEGKVSFDPEGSDWLFSLSLRYGRSNNHAHAHAQTTPPPFPHGFNGPYVFRFSDTSAESHETNATIDFKAGKDVGLGMFGRAGTSVLSAGVRFAQFTSKSHAAINADPDHQYYFKYFPSRHSSFPLGHHQHVYTAFSDMDRSFRGVGPSISWDASASLVGSRESGEVTLDWGANAAALFGRQSSQGQHKTSGEYYYVRFFPSRRTSIPIHHTTNLNRSRSVLIPNVGGFAGTSLRWSNAKISLGYRADFFFGAMDGGVDARKTYDRGFYGPFATISVDVGG
jgi:iron complex outermembrane recepter protein